MRRIVIVGAGQGGYQVATSLRECGLQGAITILGDEPGLPYQRPPLSKAYLLGKLDRSGLDLRPETYFSERRIEIRTGQRAQSIDRDAKVVRLQSGEAVPYDALVLATGARNRALPVDGAELDGVVQLRTLVDAAAIGARLGTARHAIVVGAGFIGLEFAAVASALGIGVTVLEASARLMSRAVSPPISDFITRAHGVMGVDLQVDATAVRLIGQDGRVTGVELSDGRRFLGDLVLVGIGVIPNVELAAEAGLSCRNGIEVDAFLRTADPAISAIGDCAVFPDASNGGMMTRLESVQNAVDGARCVAARLAGSPKPFSALPWFWSDQGAHKLQIAGLDIGSDSHVVRGDPDGGTISVFCYKGDRLLAVESANRPLDHVMARKFLQTGVPPSPQQAADPSFNLRDCLSKSHDRQS